MLKMTFLDYLHINKYLNESILPLRDFKTGPQWEKYGNFAEIAVLQQKLFLYLIETMNKILYFYSLKVNQTSRTMECWYLI